MNNTIMIIDDEQMILDMLRDQFETEQYRVITAKSSEEALRKLNGQPDIILLDINMPGMDGLELCRIIRDHVTCPILFLTARIEEADCVAGLRAGGDDYIMKPFSLAELMARVEAHLRRENRMEFDIVELLSLHPGQVFNRETIYERVRGFDGTADNTVVKEHIRRIRNKIGSQHIETVWGCGYKWVK